jgi:hypothetical protein
MAEIFNKEALNALDDHSEEEEMARVTSPSLVVVLGTMLIICLVAIFWCVFGTINYKVTGTGIIFPFGEPVSVSVPYDGTVDKVLVKHGEAVNEGDAMIRVRNSLATTTLSAPRDGVLLSNLSEGEAFKAREAVLWLMPQKTEFHEREILCYVDAKSLRKLKVGMEVQVTPADLQRETWGYAYGHVVGLEPFPTLQTEVTKRMKLEQFASFVPKDQPMYELRVVLDTDGNNLKWSRKKSQRIEMKNGTLCNIQIINSEKKVWEVLVNKSMDTIDNIMGN